MPELVVERGCGSGTRIDDHRPPLAKENRCARDRCLACRSRRGPRPPGGWATTPEKSTPGKAWLADAPARRGEVRATLHRGHSRRRPSRRRRDGSDARGRRSRRESARPTPAPSRPGRRRRWRGSAHRSARSRRSWSPWPRTSCGGSGRATAAGCGHARADDLKRVPARDASPAARSHAATRTACDRCRRRDGDRAEEAGQGLGGEPVASSRSAGRQEQRVAVRLALLPRQDLDGASDVDGVAGRTDRRGRTSLRQCQQRRREAATAAIVTRALQAPQDMWCPPATALGQGISGALCRTRSDLVLRRG